MKYLFILILSINAGKLLSGQNQEFQKINYTTASKKIVSCDSFRATTKFSEIFNLMPDDEIITYTVKYIPVNGNLQIYICNGDLYSDALTAIIKNAPIKSMFLFGNITITKKGIQSNFPKEGYIALKII